MTSTQTDLLTWICAQLTTASIVPYTGVAPIGATYPFAVISIVGSLSDYTLSAASGMRIDGVLVSIAIYNNSREPMTLVTLEQTIASALEDSFNVAQGTSIIMSCDKKTSLGPMWNNHDNYWQMTVDWLIRIRTL